MSPAVRASVSTSASASPSSGERIFNFSAGPATLPEEVIREVQQDVWSLSGTGVGILEHSHRGPTFDALLAETFEDCRAVGHVPDTHEVLFVPGGATVQFDMIPMSFLHPGSTSDYLDTGVWAHKATHAAQHLSKHREVGAVNVAFDGRPTKYDHVPSDAEIKSSPKAAYLHYCSNNTVFATQFRTPPKTSAPLICDASSDIFSRPWDVSRHALIYASGQKNLGPSGMVVVIVDRDFMASGRSGLPLMLDYRTYLEGESRPNTPNTFGIYLMGRVFKWILRQGGVAGLQKRNAEKARVLYEAIDSSGGFYTGLAKFESRSLMNVSFRLPTPALDDRFAAEATKAGLDGLKGHRDAGGVRASIYNPMPIEGCQALVQFMREFARVNG